MRRKLLSSTNFQSRLWYRSIVIGWKFHIAHNQSFCSLDKNWTQHQEAYFDELRICFLFQFAYYLRSDLQLKALIFYPPQPSHHLVVQRILARRNLQGHGDFSRPCFGRYINSVLQSYIQLVNKAKFWNMNSSVWAVWAVRAARKKKGKDFWETIEGVFSTFWGQKKKLY